MIFLIFMLKTLIVGTRYNRLAEAVLTSTHKLCFDQKIRKIGIPLHTPCFLYKIGYKGVYFTRTCYMYGDDM